MSERARSIFLLLLVLGLAGISKAQNPKTEAFLRANESPHPSDDQYYYVEVNVDVPLKQEVYDRLLSGNPPRVGLLMSNKTTKPVAGTASFKNILVVSPGDKDRTHFRIYVPRDMDPFNAIDDQLYQVNLTDLYVDDKDQSLFRIAPVGKILTAKASTGFLACGPDQFSIQFKYSATNASQLAKANQLHQYLDAVRKDSSKLARLKIKVEPLTQEKVTTLAVRGLSLNPDLPAMLAQETFLSVCFETGHGVPTEAFDAKVLWDTDAPKELTDQSIFSDLKGRTSEASPTVFVDKEKAVGLRPIDKDLNIAASLVSSVKDEEQEDKTMVRKRTTRGTLDLRLGFLRDFKRLKVGVKNVDACGTVKEFTPATAAASGSIKLNAVTFGIAPGVKLDAEKGTRQCLHFTDIRPNGDLADPKILPYHGPEATGGTYLIFTPAYLDAKVSTGSIVKDTLSLNRVIFGTQAEFRYLPRIGGYANYYRFIFQGNHSSDRDFKQKEFSGTFKFQPVFGFLNHPLDPEHTKPEKRQLCTSCDPDFKRIPIRHGFEFVPGIGVEIGRTYSRRNPAAAIEASDTVRRLSFQLDTVLNPTENLRLSASEIFYIRGESKTDRYHNYFLGDVSYGLGSFAHTNANQSIFFSWERGGQPPFADADVNVLKFGFRITSTTLFSRHIY